MGEQYNRVKIKYIQNVINMMTLFGDLLPTNKLKTDAKRQVMTEETMKKKVSSKSARRREDWDMGAQTNVTSENKV